MSIRAFAPNVTDSSRESRYACRPGQLQASPRLSGHAYAELTRVSIETYLLPKIAASGLSVASDARVAFMLKLNAKAILKSFAWLPIGGQAFPISEDLIAATSSGYPGGDSLKSIYRLAP
jgi:hypothetical protein